MSLARVLQEFPFDLVVGNTHSFVEFSQGLSDARHKGNPLLDVVPIGVIG